MGAFTIGADPEVFLETKKKGEVVPSQGRVLGTKSAPEPIGKALTGFFSQRDNVAAEYNIPVCHSEPQFTRAIQHGQDALYKSIPYGKRKNIQISKRASANFKPKYLENEEACNFGCEPDFNAWTISENSIDKTKVDPTFRTAGGHVHVGYHDTIRNLNPLALVRAMDLYLGVPSVLLDPDKERRKLYGKAGAYRPTKYGLEYRTLSNFWIHTPEHVRWVYRGTSNAVFYAERYPVIEPDSQLGSAIQAAINNQDLDAIKVVTSLVLGIPKLEDYYPKKKQDDSWGALPGFTSGNKYAVTWTTVSTGST